MYEKIYNGKGGLNDGIYENRRKIPKNYLKRKGK